MFHRNCLQLSPIIPTRQHTNLHIEKKTRKYFFVFHLMCRKLGWKLQPSIWDINHIEQEMLEWYRNYLEAGNWWRHMNRMPSAKSHRAVTYYDQLICTGLAAILVNTDSMNNVRYEKLAAAICSRWCNMLIKSTNFSVLFLSITDSTQSVKAASSSKNFDNGSSAPADCENNTRSYKHLSSNGLSLAANCQCLPDTYAVTTTHEIDRATPSVQT